MKLRTKSFIILVALILPALTVAQTSEPEFIETPAGEWSQDFTMRAGFDITRELYKGLSLNWEEEARFKNNVTQFDRLYSTIALDYEVNSYFKAGVSYAFHLIQQSEGWQFRHRVCLNLTGSYKYNQWKFSLRARPLMTYRMDKIDPLEKEQDKWQLRTQFSTEYSCKNVPLKSYLSFELSNTLNAPEFAQGNYVDGTRSVIGLKWNIDKRNTLDFYYRFDCEWARDISVTYSEINPTEITKVDLTHGKEMIHIVGVAYSFDWIKKQQD